MTRGWRLRWVSQGDAAGDQAAAQQGLHLQL
jgi:hypothetical protein